MESPTIRSYRELLGVDSGANAEELKKAYHRLAFLYHPDRNPSPDASDQFEQVKLAYEVLKDATRVERLNRFYLRERLFVHCIEGINICFGSFFGYRLYQPDKMQAFSEENHSILDHPAFDSLELVFAGKFSPGDEERLQSGLSGDGQMRLPWVILNNQGILHFLNAEYVRSMKCYEELNRRIPNNIIFLYRLGVCQIVLAFKEGKKSFWGAWRPRQSYLESGLKCLRHCIKIAEERPVGRQRCLVIRKLLGEVLEKSGRRREALKIWREVHRLEPTSVEAAVRLGLHLKEGRELQMKRIKGSPAPLLLLSSSR